MLARYLYLCFKLVVMKRETKIALGILGAAAAGIIIGGLFYTDKGKEIRRQLGSKATDLKDNIADLVNRGKQKASETMSDISRKMNGIKTNVEDIIA